MNSERGLSQFIFLENGRLQLRLADGVLPEFLAKANVAVNRGRLKEAAGLLTEQNVELVQQMVEPKHLRAVVMFVLARLFSEIGQMDKAEQWYKKVLELEEHGLVYDGLANICIENTARFSEAVAYSRKAVEAEPDNQLLRASLGMHVIKGGQLQEGVELLRKAREKMPPDLSVDSIYLWYLHYLVDIDRQMLFDEYRKWGRTHFPVSMARQSHDNDYDGDRKIRVGYISPDFRMHSVARSFEPFLDGHDREVLEVYGYGKVKKPDKITERFKDKFDYYRSIFGMSDSEAAALIEQDKIDILVEIGGHSFDNCLGVLAYKPAPIQVDYGGINTSGMEQIDYRFTDTQLDPPELQKYYVEESVCLGGGFFSYRPPHSSPLVGPLAAKRKGYVTFGVFNNNLKINPYIMGLWAQILKADDTSHLLLKFGGGRDQAVGNRYLDQLEALGISRERVEIRGLFHSHFEHMQLYNEIDLMLDTYPFNGCITTLEGLWMGVPTVSLVGDNSLLSRAGLSILSRVGLEIFTAATSEEYVGKAIAFAGELDNLSQIRATLRQLMLKSDLCNIKKFTTGVEAAYRKMWHRWCMGRGDKTSALGTAQERGIPDLEHDTAEHRDLRSRRIFVSSMSRSGSMWAYNVTRSLIYTAGMEPVPQSVPAGNDVPYLRQAYNDPVGRNQVYCVKTHNLITTGRPDILIITTYRDVRDSVVSLMRFARASFEQALSAARDWMKVTDSYFERQTGNILRIRYDDIICQPLDIIERINCFIGTGAGFEDIETINARFCRT